MVLYNCKKCNYLTKNYSDWKKHCNTNKHKGVNNNNNDDVIFDNSSKQLSCEKCGKKYKYLSGLSRHRLKCNVNNNNEIIQQQGEQIKNLQSLLEKTIQSNNDTISKLIPKMGNVTNNINNKMTLNLYLNQHCKDAMNLTEFMNKLTLSIDDLNYTRNNGYIKGITNIFVKNLSEMDPTERPIHCSDKNKLKFYVKESDKWNQDKKNEKIDHSIQCITQKQIQKIKEWESQHPGWETSEKDTNLYIETIGQIMGGKNEIEKQKNMDIIKKEIGTNIEINYKDIKEN